MEKLGSGLKLNALILLMSFNKVNELSFHKGGFGFYCIHCFSCVWIGWTCLISSFRSPRRCKAVLGFCCSSSGGRSSGRPSISVVGRGSR